MWLCAAGFLLGFVRIFITFPLFDAGDVAFYRDMPQSIVLEGYVAAEPEFRNDAQYLLVEGMRLDERFEVQGKVLVKGWRYPEYRYGDHLTLKGHLQKPAEFESFSYADYLAKDGIYAVMYQPRIRLVERPRLLDGWTAVLGLKRAVRDRVEALFGEPGAGIVLGLLLGMRSSIPEEILEDFQRSGLTHILAISGYNITLLITIVGVFLQSFGRRIRFVATWMAIAFFALLTGLSASVVRASIMGALTVFTLFQGRKSDGVPLLLMSGFCMVAANPRILVWDVSFQLSFVSTLGLMLLMPLWEPYLRKMPAFLAEGLAVTMAATIFTLPIVLFHFGAFSLISPLANVIFLPFIPLIMLFSFFAVASASLVLPITFVWVGISWLLLQIFLEGVGVVADIPLAFIEIPAFPWWAVVVYYAAVWKLIVLCTPR